MVSALYRRYRPETFSELIGQAHVTDPLTAALRTDRVNHAYLFSGPRGCGKTTSARILARCLNCAAGPTDTPCGTCPSCIELGRDGGGSIDVIEIDAASHGGVDDARDLRERATLAPNRDRYKIYIIDEAHMVSKDGFNALLKIVEEPPEHVKFIFATTEPEKVIGTIRSRTHHYPFRLIAPSLLLEYVTELSQQEGVEIEPGVLPMVIRGGGGSARDTLSLLDQLMAGSEGAVTYQRAAALLGFTPAELLDDVTAALAAKDAQGAFGAVDRVMQAGQDPRRFVEDLLEHLRDLIIAAVAEDAESILHGVQSDEIDRMRERAHEFGPAALSQAADTVAKSLSAMTGATSPKLQLELLLARLLVTGDPATPAATARAAQPRNARGEPQQGAPGDARAARGAPPADARAAEPEQPAAMASAAEPQAAETSTPDPEPMADARVEQEEAPQDASGSGAPVGSEAAADSRPNLEAAAASFRAAASAPAPESRQEPPQPEPAQPTPGEFSFAQIEDAWPEVMQQIEHRSRRAWMLANAMRPVDYVDGKLGVAFRSARDKEEFRVGRDGEVPLWQIIAQALTDRFGRKFGFAPRDSSMMDSTQAAAAQSNASQADEARPGAAPVEAPPSGPAEPEPSAPADSAPSDSAQADSAPSAGASSAAAPAAAAPPAQPEPARAPRPEPERQRPQAATPSAAASGGWAVAQIPQDAPSDADAPVDPWAEATPNATNTTATGGSASQRPAARMPEVLRSAPPPVEPEPLSAAESSRYGEAVIREELGAEFLEEITDEGGR